MSQEHDVWLEGLGVDLTACREGGYEAERHEKPHKPKQEKHHHRGGTKVEGPEASGSFKAGWKENRKTGATMGGVKMRGRAVGFQIEHSGADGQASGSFFEAEGSAQAGYEYNPKTGREFAGVKASGKVAVAEVNADTPLGKVSGSFMKAEASAQAGYEYDP